MSGQPRQPRPRDGLLLLISLLILLATLIFVFATGVRADLPVH